MHNSTTTFTPPAKTPAKRYPDTITAGDLCSHGTGAKTRYNCARLLQSATTELQKRLPHVAVRPHRLPRVPGDRGA